MKTKPKIGRILMLGCLGPLVCLAVAAADDETGPSTVDRLAIQQGIVADKYAKLRGRDGSGCCAVQLYVRPGLFLSAACPGYCCCAVLREPISAVCGKLEKRLESDITIISGNTIIS